MKNQAATDSALYIVATPIGHLDDITLRAIQVLKDVDLILAENPHHSSHLLNAFAIKTPVRALHMHNEEEILTAMMNALEKGESIALISDAGTPLISDPGFLLVHEAKKKGFRVVPIPGPSAPIAALSAAGVPATRFMFEGFLPPKLQARQTRLKALKKLGMTVICFEAPHRVAETLADIALLFGTDYKMVLAKELTKTFEHIEFATVLALQNWLLAEKAHEKGEFVIILPFSEEDSTFSEEDSVLETLLDELPLKQAVHLASRITNLPKNALYERALLLKGKREDLDPS